MTEITTVGDGSPVLSTDRILLVRAGVALTVTVAELVASTFQAALSLEEATLLGRSSNSTGGPQAIGVSTGLAIAEDVLVANGDDHAGLFLLSWMDQNAELIVNSAGVPSRLPFAFVGEYFQSSLGNVASVWLDQNGQSITDQNGDPILG
jgi:hypothetical protein